jgi:glycosidase
MAHIRGMGVTAIWISPAVDNENLNLNSGDAQKLLDCIR